jgi:hypothetical protein
MVVKQTPQRGKKPEEEVKKFLNEQEEKELAEGQALFEMDKNNLGWQIIKQWLTDAAYHSWVDPRQTDNKEEWEWRELNAFHAANTAKEILEEVAKSVSRAEYLDKVKHGEIQRNKMRIV